MGAISKGKTLTDLQEYTKHQLRERGFDDETVTEKCLLLGEEVGELFKAVRQHTNIKTDQHAEKSSIEDELADILIYLLDISNKLDIDLEKAFLSKEEKNKKRTWK
jgi:NTP pyrophosphatase (non-canonical NTP hydrolase)